MVHINPKVVVFLPPRHLTSHSSGTVSTSELIFSVHLDQVKSYLTCAISFFLPILVLPVFHFEVVIPQSNFGRGSPPWSAIVPITQEGCTKKVLFLFGLQA